MAKSVFPPGSRARILEKLPQTFAQIPAVLENARMSSIRHVSCGFFESRVRFIKHEVPRRDGKAGIREYRHPLVQFFAQLFGLAVNIEYRSRTYCLNKKSLFGWMERNHIPVPAAPAFPQLIPELIGKIHLRQKFSALKEEIAGFQQKPPDIIELSLKPPSFKRYRELKKWRSARDVLMVWDRVSKALKEGPVDFDLLQAKEHWRAKAKGFSDWLSRRCGKIEGLSKLNFSGLGLHALPKEIGRFRNIEWLDLSENHLKELPDEIAALDRLQFLFAPQNRIERLPPGIGKLLNLKCLFIAQNRLREIPREIRHLRRLEALLVSRNRLREIPQEIGLMTRLQRLDLHENQLHCLPRQLGKLARLQTLSLYCNKLKALPEEIGGLTSLELLSLHHNALEGLPQEIGKLLQLEKLLVSHNRLKWLPEEICKLPKLKTVQVMHNRGLKLSEDLKDALSCKGVELYA